MTTDEVLIDDDFLFYSLLYSSITLAFAMAVLSKFLTNEFRFGFRSILSLGILFIGEPMCHFFMKGPSGVAIFGLGCLFIYSILPASHLPAKGKTVLVTGCDSGFGQALVKKLDSIGMKVYAGCLYRNGPGALKLMNECSDNLTVLQLDVTKEDEVQGAYGHIVQHVGEQGLWGVVNNAGLWYLADVEMTPESIFRRVMEVNLFGTVRVTKTFLPLVRKSKGRIVNMSSLTGKVPFEGFGAYATSKHAIEGFTDVLRQEMKQWGVTVCTVEPSGFNTAALNEQVLKQRMESLWTHLDDTTKEEYGRKYLEQQYENLKQSSPKFPKDLTPVIRALRSGLLSKRPLEKYAVGKGAGTLLGLYPVLPVWMADRFTHMIGNATADDLPAALKREKS